MNPRKPLLLTSLFFPSLQSQAAIPPQQYDYSTQVYQEDDGRIRVESEYLRGKIELDEATSFRFQWLSDTISGASPTGAWPGGSQPYLAEVEDVRKGILGAISRQFGDHRVELEVSRSAEDDYISRGFALSDSLELNQKNTTVSYGANYLNDTVLVPTLGERGKDSYDLFSGITQIIDKDTVVSANLTLGYGEGYLHDPYKGVQRDEELTIPIGPNPEDIIVIPLTNIYRENRPTNRFRQVLQLGGKHYFTAADGVLDGTLRLSNDDYGVFSQTLQVEWRQAVGERFQAVPFFRYYRQNAADFFVNTLNDLNIDTPANDPNGSGPNYSADYRLSALDAVSGGLRVSYQFNDHLSASACYERYVMNGNGNANERSPGPSYPSADIWTIGVSAKF
ncbi:MAG: DUF3570 domain-containing protein [Akkermansiaceae bacterium]|nr:DUF3570 domain-containing protein [Akkermansiaceae bacterium]